MFSKTHDVTKLLVGNFAATPVESGESGCSTVRLEDKAGTVRAYMKYGSGPLAEMVADEMVRLRWMRPRLPVPPIIQFVASADECWLVTEAIHLHSARQLLDERRIPSNVIVDALANFMRSVHGLSQDECPYDARLARRLIDARARIDAGLVDVEDFDDAQLGWTAEDVWAALHALLPQAPDIVVTHGDFSLDNILLDGQGAVACIDVGGAGLADRYQDVAICWADLAEYGTDLQARFLNQYGVGTGDAQKLKTYQLLNELF